MPEVKVQLKYLRMSPKKVRLVADLIRGKEFQEAKNQLLFSKKAASRPLKKLLDSAFQAAKERFHLKEEELFIKRILVNEGPTLYRFKARAFGRATPIRKRSSHILLVLDKKLDKRGEKKTNKEKK